MCAVFGFLLLWIKGAAKSTVLKKKKRKMQKIIFMFSFHSAPTYTNTPHETFGKEIRFVFLLLLEFSRLDSVFVQLF